MSDDSSPNAPLVDDTEAGSDSDVAAESTVVTAREARRQRLGVAIASAILAIGLFLVFRGIMAGVTGDDRARYPNAIEEVMPVPDAVQAFGRDSVVVDFVSGYTGELTIDGIAIDTVAIGDYVDPNPQPGDQVDLPPVAIYEPGNATLTFTPSAAAPIEEFAVGSHTVQVEYWKLVDGRQRPRVYVWTFNVV